ncbi:MAG: UDP-N-acetylmuramate--L-alanine ligase [Bdellovibrionales bacterium]|nr:UDP-N-acetylmuramate--L-alanine ligase [Bdellovibrionales bacterium]
MTQTLPKPDMIHMVGIGGIGMSGIAQILLRSGYRVSGSDFKTNEETEKLKALGCHLYTGHQATNLSSQVRTVVYSSAISQNNVELLEAKRRNINILSRADMLAELMRKKRSIVVAGSHGKTTTSAMITTMLMQSGYDPTSIIGGRLKSIAGNARIGSDEWFVAESDESDGSFVKLLPTIGVVTNIDREHMNHYGTYAKLEQAFVEFCEHIPFDGQIIICADNAGSKTLIKLLDRKIVTYGTGDKVHLRATDIQLSFQGASYSVVDRSSGFLGEVNLKVTGTHNVLNSLAAVSVGLFLNIPLDRIAKGLGEYEGISRRLEYKGRSKNGCLIYDDYAHHPSEIRASLEALRVIAKDKPIHVIFQPHRYSRFGDLWTDFLESFEGVRSLYVLPVFTAHESEIPGITSEAFVEQIKKHRHIRAQLSTSFDDALEAIKACAKKDDIVVCMGAGDITKIAAELVQ